MPELMPCVRVACKLPHSGNGVMTILARRYFQLGDCMLKSKSVQYVFGALLYIQS